MLPAEHLPAARPILVVEDDDDTRDALCQLLNGQGYVTAAAANGHEALRWLGGREPSLIITDLSMPVMTGWQLLEHVRSRPAWGHIPVIVLSADSPPPGDEWCFMQKPVPAPKLLREIATKVAGPLSEVAKPPRA